MQATSLPIVQIARTVPVHGNEQLGLGERKRADEIRRRHADNRAGLTVHPDGLPHD